jgi:hypothetical protein
MVFPHRRALRARLRPFRYTDRTCLNISHRDISVDWDKVTAGLNPAVPATLVLVATRSG